MEEGGKEKLATKIGKQLMAAKLGPREVYIELALIQPNWLRYRQSRFFDLDTDTIPKLTWRL